LYDDDHHTSFKPEALAQTAPLTRHYKNVMLDTFFQKKALD
jgi:hypothetical protein